MVTTNLGMLKQIRQMGDRLKSNPVNKELRSIAIDKIRSIEQVRKTFTDLESLSESIKTSGLQQPITVYRDPTNDDNYIILQGERRFRAARMAGLERIDCIVGVRPEEDANRIIRQIIENNQREDTPIMETAAAIKALHDTGMKNKTIAERLGRTPQLVSMYLDITDMPPFLTELAQHSVNDLPTLRYLKKLYSLAEDAQDRIGRVLDEDDYISRANAKKLVDDFVAEQAAIEERRKMEALKDPLNDASVADGGDESGENDSTDGEEQAVDHSAKKTTAKEPHHELLPNGCYHVDQSYVYVTVKERPSGNIVDGFLTPNVCCEIEGMICVTVGGESRLVKCSDVRIVNRSH